MPSLASDQKLATVGTSKKPCVFTDHHEFRRKRAVGSIRGGVDAGGVGEDAVAGAADEGAGGRSYYPPTPRG